MEKKEEFNLSKKYDKLNQEGFDTGRGISTYELEKVIKEFIQQLKDKTDKFIFPECEECGACFCIHVKEEFKERVINSLTGGRFVK